MWSRLRQALAEEAGMPAVLDKAGEHSFVAAFEGRPVVVDLGANRGGFAREVLARFPSARLVLVEANPVLAEDLRRAFADLPNARVIAAAVGPEPRERAEFHISRDDRASSLHRHLSASHGLDEGGAVTVRMTTVGALAGECGLSRIDLLKIDVEGAELDILETLGPELDWIDQISVEFHDFVDPALRPRVRMAVARLKCAGYRCYCWSTNYMHGSPYVDCLFYRPLPRIVRVLRRRRAAAAMRLPWRLAVRIVRRISGAPGLQARGGRRPPPRT